MFALATTVNYAATVPTTRKLKNCQKPGMEQEEYIIPLLHYDTEAMLFTLAVNNHVNYKRVYLTLSPRGLSNVKRYYDRDQKGTSQLSALFVVSIASRWTSRFTLIRAGFL